MRFAAIDVGSNAVRLLLARVEEESVQPVYEKVALLRMPIRLGEDAFPHKKISEDKIEQLIKTMTGFKYLMDAFEPIDYMACATSAMRESSNNIEIVERIRKRSGIELSIISGKREAEIIYYNHVERLADDNCNACHMYVDVGGGSTEIIVFNEHKIMESRSFDIGSIRIHEGLVTRRDWEDMKLWVKHVSSRHHPISAIGSGGNINFLFNISKTKDCKPIEYNRLKKLHSYIRSFTIEQRISELRMRPDRADVIVDAAKIYLSVMKWSGINEIFVPQMGLADGIIHVLYRKHKQTFV